VLTVQPPDPPEPDINVPVEPVVSVFDETKEPPPPMIDEPIPDTMMPPGWAEQVIVQIDEKNGAVPTPAVTAPMGPVAPAPGMKPETKKLIQQVALTAGIGYVIRAILGG
jgi:hypothetical protein